VGVLLAGDMLSDPARGAADGTVGRALEQQLRPVADDLTGHLVQDCGHIIPLDRPQELLRLLAPFLAADQPAGPRDRTPPR
jgi:pimeloyl-ACP methyl ester carboxylesterase